MRPTIFGLLTAAIAALAPALAAGGEQEDAQFAQYVAMSLRDSGRVQHYSIGVKYTQGTVWLTGKVNSKEQMTAALEVVSDMRGVRKVVNNLTVSRKNNAQGKTNPKMRQPGESRSPSNSGSPRRPPNGPSSKPGGVQLAGASMPVGPAGRPRPMRGPQGIPDGYNESADETVPSQMNGSGQRPRPAYTPGMGGGNAPTTYDQANVPNYSWPSYAAYPNYAAVTYPKQYSASAWPFIGPFYPYPQVPLGWRKVSLEWKDGWWFLDFDDRGCQ